MSQSPLPDWLYLQDGWKMGLQWREKGKCTKFHKQHYTRSSPRNIIGPHFTDSNIELNRVESTHIWGKGVMPYNRPQLDPPHSWPPGVACNKSPPECRGILHHSSPGLPLDCNGAESTLDQFHSANPARSRPFVRIESNMRVGRRRVLSIEQLSGSRQSRIYM